MHPRRCSHHRARRRLLPNAGEARGLLRRGRRGAGREPSRRRGGQTSSSRSRARATRCCAASGSPPGALVAAAGANVVNRRELDNAVLERARFVCCDWLEQARLEVGRPRRAGRARRPRLAGGPRAPRGRGRRDRRADSRTTTSSSSSRTGSRRGTSPSAREAVRLARERGVGTEPLGRQHRRPSRPRRTSFAERLDDLRPVEQPPLLLRASRRFWTYLSSRISVSDLPRSCSRTTYRATCSSAEPRENRNENDVLEPRPRDAIVSRARCRRSSREGSVRRADARRRRRRRRGGADRRSDRAPARSAVGRRTRRQPSAARGRTTRGPRTSIFEGYELGDALDRANEALEDDVQRARGGRPRGGRASRSRARRSLPPLERWFFNR